MMRLVRGGHALRGGSIGCAAAGQIFDLLDQCVVGYAGSSQRFGGRTAALTQ